jgi:hypothetical protein
MSWTKDITIWCDDEGCAQWVMSDVVKGRTVAATRLHAASRGWVFRDGKDLCPIHVKERTDD